MRKIDLIEFGPVISDKEIGNKIYSIIKNYVDKEPVELDLSGIKSMATFCAKQVFGNLYLELGSQKFFDRVHIKNANDDVKTIIKIGIQHALKKD
jgi:hypothetical protein